MRRPTPAVALLALLAVLALGFVACGDGGGGSSSSAYCDQLDKSAKEASAPTTTATGPSTTVDYADVQKKFDVALEKIQSKAPSELKEHYVVVNDYFTLYLKALAKDPAADTKKLQEMGPKYQTAQQAIAKYNKDTCKFEITTTVPASSPTPTTAKS